MNLNLKKPNKWFLGLLAALTIMSVSPVSINAAGVSDLKGTLTAEETVGKAGGVKSGSTETDVKVEAAFTKEVLLNCDGPNDYTGEGVNICGQYAMSTVLKYYGYSENYTEVMENTNPSGLSFTAPDRISFYLKGKGVDVSYRNNGTVDQITSAIDGGAPVICLVATEDSTHWITIIGYKKNDDGSVKSLIMRDSYWGVNSNYEMQIAQFKEYWKKPLGNLGSDKVGKLTDTVFSYKNLIMTFSGKKSLNLANKIGLPGQFSTATDDQLLNGANLVATGWFQKDAAKVIVGAAETLSAIPQKLATLPGTLAIKAGQNVSAWGKEKSQSAGTLNKVTGTLAQGAGAVMQTAGTVVTTVGNAVSSVLETGFNNVKRLFNW